MKVVCLDLEGVLIPEIWIEVSNRVGVDALKLTTRDISDYDALMRHRLDVLDAQRISLADIQAVIATLQPLAGAVEFIAWIRERFQLAVLSDTFYEFAEPVMRQLGWPMLLCNRLETDGRGMVTGYRVRQKDPKRQVVIAFHAMNFQVLAAGDSYNDSGMLDEADAGFWFRPPERVMQDLPQYPVTHEFSELQKEFLDASARLDAE